MSLQQIHSKEIIHLDLQPSNLLVIDDIDEEVADDSGKQSDVSNTINDGTDAKSICSWYEQEQRKIIHITNFCNSSGFTRKKFSTNQISSLYFMSPERIVGEINTENE